MKERMWKTSMNQCRESGCWADMTVRTMSPSKGSCSEDKSAVLVLSWKALWAVSSVQVCPFHCHMPWETELRSHLKRQVVRKVHYRVTTCQGSKVGFRVILFYWFLFVLWGRQCFECLNVCIRIVLNPWLAITQSRFLNRSTIFFSSLWPKECNTGPLMEVIFIHIISSVTGTLLFKFWNTMMYVPTQIISLDKRPY